MTALFLKQTPIVATFHRSGDSRSIDYLNRGALASASDRSVCRVSEEALRAPVAARRLLRGAVQRRRRRPVPAERGAREERPTVLFYWPP